MTDLSELRGRVDRDPMPGSVRELVRDLLRMTQGEGGK